MASTDSCIGKELSAGLTGTVFCTAMVAGSTHVRVALPSLKMRDVWSVVAPQPSGRGPAADFTLSRLLTGYSYSFPLFQISW